MDQVTLAIGYWRSMIMRFGKRLKHEDKRRWDREKCFLWDHRKEHFGNH